MKTESKELTVPERAAVALGSSKCEAELKALIEASKEITIITNAAGRDECHASAMRAVKARTGIAGTGKAVREDSTAFAKAVIAEENRLIAIIEPEEIRLKALRDAWDEKIAAEKAEKARIEAERQARIQSAIDVIRNAPQQCIACTSDGARSYLDTLAEIDLSEEVFAERRDEAEYIMGQSIQQIEAMIAGKRAQEELAAQMESQRIENERKAAELAAQQAAEEQRQREALQAEAERQRVQAEEIAKQRAELDAMISAQKAEAEKLETQRIAMQEEDDRKAKAESDAMIAAEQLKAGAALKAQAMAQEAEIEAVRIEERRKAVQLAESANNIKPVEVKTVTIPLAEYAQLLRDQNLLSCLRGAGVDNWEGWDDALTAFNEMAPF